MSSPNAMTPATVNLPLIDRDEAFAKVREEYSRGEDLATPDASRTMRSHAMPKVQDHLRRTFLAGIFAAVPIAVTIFIVWYIDGKTRNISHWMFHRDIPLVGILIAIVVIYLCGLAATNVLGKFFLRMIDRILTRVPILRPLYIAWKQIALTPGGTEGTFSRVVLIPDETGATHLLGFSCGRPLEGDPGTFCVFVPAAPNPINGRLYFVRREKCVFVDISTEDAFKIILSTGNYVPREVGDASKMLMEPVPAEKKTTISRGL